MESLYASFVSLFVFLVSLSLYFIFSKNESGSGGAPLPPGKTGWPIIGETLNFLATGWNGRPEKFTVDRISKYSSQVFRTHILGTNVAVFCGASGNKFLFSNENKLVRVWWPSSIDKVLSYSHRTSTNEEAIKMRKMLPNFLKPEALQRYVGIMDHTARRHFEESWENKQELVVFSLAKDYTFRIACRLFVNIEDPNHVKKISGPFSELAKGLISMPIDLPGTPFNKAIKAANFIRKEFTAIIKQRKIDVAKGKVSPMQDIMSHMLLTSDEDGKVMNQLDVANNVMGLIIGGHDPASSACTFVVKFLAEVPEIYDIVYKEQMEISSAKSPGELLTWDDIQKMKYSWNVVCEVLRLVPPLRGAFREALSDFMFNGFSIPKGWKIYWSTYSTHVDPSCFPNPKKFDPSRYEGTGPAPYTFVPFGGGPRMCPGRDYARLEILVFMHHLVKRFKWQKIITDEKIVVNPMPVPANGLPVRLYPHKA